MIIKSRNTLDINAPITYLTNPEVGGTNVLRWRNPNGFQSSWAVQIGKTGAEMTEILLLGTATPGTSGTFTANSLYPHSTDTPLYATKYDQLVFEVSLTGTSGVAAPLTGGTVTIQADQPYTQFEDTAGSTAYAYKTYYKNSVLNATSTESDWITSTGFRFASLGKLRQRVKDKLYTASFIPNDLMIDDWLNEWLGRMNNTMVDVNEDYGLGTTSVSYAGTTDLGTITNNDFKGIISRVWYVEGSGTFQATKMAENSFSPTKIFVNTFPYYFMEGDTIIGRRPNDTSGTFLITYPKIFPILVEDTDELPVAMHNHTSGFVNYAVSQAKGKDNKPQEMEAYMALAEKSADRFKLMIAPRLRSGPTMMEIQEWGADDFDSWM